LSRPAPFETADLPLADDPFEPGAALRARRLDSARARRKRLLLVDAAIGAALGLLGLILAPGLAIGVLVALVLLAGCALAVAVERLRARRRTRVPRAQAVDPAARGALRARRGP
jgi:hypothetical protein